MLSLFTIMRRNPVKAGLEPGSVILTFDDGPNLQDEVTPRLLNVLHRHSVKAGFCLIGNQVRQYPELVRRMYHSGHLLINHTQTHEHPVRQNYSTLLAEVEQCDREIGAVLGIDHYRSRYFRSPFGIVTIAARRVIRKLNMSSALLTHYGWDTRVSPDESVALVDELIENAKQHQGGMYVFHDGDLCSPTEEDVEWSQSPANRSWIPDAVDRVITELKMAGLRFSVPGTSDQTAEVILQKSAA